MERRIDRRVRPDAQRERQDRHDRDEGALEQGPKRQLQIPHPTAWGVPSIGQPARGERLRLWVRGAGAGIYYSTQRRGGRRGAEGLRVATMSPRTTSRDFLATEAPGAT